jgi:hypothetical protein
MKLNATSALIGTFLSVIANTKIKLLLKVGEAANTNKMSQME